MKRAALPAAIAAGFIMVWASANAQAGAVQFVGKLEGDTMTLKMKAGNREAIDVTAKRAR